MIFLIVIAAIWIIAASISDIRKREVPNWINFSLIAVGLAYRVLFSLINNDFNFFLQGVLGMAIFVGLGYAFYYGRVFAGGDAKLLMALGPILPFSEMFKVNVGIFLIFVFLLLLSGSFYGIIFSFFISFRNRKKFVKEFKRNFKKNKPMFYVFLVIAITAFAAAFYLNEALIFLLGAVILLFPVLFIYARSIEESSMIKSVEARKLVEGDWLYKQVKIGKKTIKPSWQGLSLQEIKLLRKAKKKVLVKEGIPFVPSFLIAFLLLIYLWNYYNSIFAFLV
ncbi:MAG: A24 family peptidase [archaeon]